MMNQIAEYNHTKQKSPIYRKIKDKENSPVQLQFSGSPLCSPKKQNKFHSQVGAFNDITNSPHLFKMQLQQIKFNDKKSIANDFSPINVLMKMKKDSSYVVSKFDN